MPALSYRLLAVASLAVLSADPISGSWAATFQVEGYPPTPAMFEFKLDGQRVTGSIKSDHTGPGKVTEGKWVNDTLSFTAVFENHESIAIWGHIEADKLVGEFKTEGFVAKWEAKKQ